MALLDVAGLVGSLLLLRRWSVARWIALPAAVSYALAPNVIVLNGFPYTFEGYLALPFLVWAALVSLDRLASGHWASGVLIALAVSFFTVFTDGYVFFSMALVVGLLALGRVVRERRGPEPALFALGVWIIALAIAALSYTASVPGNAYETQDGLETFARLGVDVVSVLVPSGRFLVPSLLGEAAPRFGYWGINETPPIFYLGWVGLGLVTGLLLSWLRGRKTALAPPNPADDARLRGIAEQLAADPRFEVTTGRWMTVLRASGGC
jgi:hypothetical protein